MDKAKAEDAPPVATTIIKLVVLLPVGINWTAKSNITHKIITGMTAGARTCFKNSHGLYPRNLIVMKK